METFLAGIASALVVIAIGLPFIIAFKTPQYFEVVYKIASYAMGGVALIVFGFLYGSIVETIGRKSLYTDYALYALIGIFLYNYFWRAAKYLKEQISKVSEQEAKTQQE